MEEIGVVHRHQKQHEDSSSGADTIAATDAAVATTSSRGGANAAFKVAAEKFRNWFRRMLRIKSILQTLTYFFLFVNLGIVISVFGPTLGMLAELNHASIEQMGYVFTVRSLGYLVGSWLFGKLFYLAIPKDIKLAFQKQEKQKGLTQGRLPTLWQVLIFCVGNVIMVGANTAVPFIRNVYLLIVVHGIQGFGVSALDVAVNTFAVWVWDEDVMGWMHFLHFGFGFGAFLCPLIINTFKLDKDVLVIYLSISGSCVLAMVLVVLAQLLPGVLDTCFWKKDQTGDAQKQETTTALEPEVEKAGNCSTEMEPVGDSRRWSRSESSMELVPTSHKATESTGGISVESTKLSADRVSHGGFVPLMTPASPAEEASTENVMVSVPLDEQQHQPSLQTVVTSEPSITSESPNQQEAPTVTPVDQSSLQPSSNENKLLSFIKKKMVPSKATKVAILLGISLLCIMGSEISFSGLINTYYTDNKIGDYYEANLLTSVFWICFTACRLISIPVSVWLLSPFQMLMIDVTGCLVSVTVMMIFPTNKVVIWIFTCLLGVSMASQFPTCIGFIGSSMKDVQVTSSMVSIQVILATFGDMLCPLIITLLWKAMKGYALLVVMLVAICVGLLTYFILYFGFLATPFWKRVSNCCKKIKKTKTSSV